MLRSALNRAVCLTVICAATAAAVATVAAHEAAYRLTHRRTLTLREVVDRAGALERKARR